MYSNVSGNITISKVVFEKMVGQIIVENKSLFIDKSYLRQKNDKKALTVNVNDEQQSLDITLDININYTKNMPEAIEKLQKEIKSMIETITGYNVNSIDINVVKLVK